MSASLSYKSSLHYIFLQPDDSKFKSDDFFSYLINEDICKLDIALSELKLRRAFHKKVGIFYDTNSIFCRSELARIIHRNVSLTKCNLDFTLSGRATIYLFMLSFEVLAFIYIATCMQNRRVTSVYFGAYLV